MKVPFYFWLYRFCLPSFEHFYQGVHLPFLFLLQIPTILPAEDVNIVKHFGKPTVASYSIGSNECCQFSYTFYSNDAEAHLSDLYLYFRVPFTAFLRSSAGATNCCWRKWIFCIDGISHFHGQFPSLFSPVCLSVHPHCPLFFVSEVEFLCIALPVL